MTSNAIKLWVTIAFLLFVVGPKASVKFDEWMNGRQEEILKNEELLESQQRAAVQARNEERMRRVRAESCERLFSSPGCSKPESFEDLEACLWGLRNQSCNDLPGVNLCAAVEEIRHCRNPRGDAVAAKCRRLRHAADCAGRPAPERPTHNWTISTPR